MPTSLPEVGYKPYLSHQGSIQDYILCIARDLEFTTCHTENLYIKIKPLDFTF